MKTSLNWQQLMQIVFNMNYFPKVAAICTILALNGCSWGDSANSVEQPAQKSWQSSTELIVTNNDSAIFSSSLPNQLLTESCWWKAGIAIVVGLSKEMEG
ncbi:MAG: hypothetical protein AAGM40_11290 [Cyanobacteria bacterium J06573_2]